MAGTECRKFMPNIFNKSKCSNCFRLKEDHSASAIQFNKASRKISKCGYLFVAPDWDFSNPVNRTKRWQRRWFVLYDDGELTYSVDDHPETIPQACIDMNRVMEVARADEVTGNPHTVALTAPERVHFVKGTCREESNWWLEVLQIFPRSSVKSGRAKRNATFPGGIATTYTPQYPANPAPAIQTPPVKCESGSGESSSGGSNAVTEDITVPSPTPDPILTSPTPDKRTKPVINIEDVTTTGYSHSSNKEATTPKHTVAPVSAQQLSSSAPPTKHLSGSVSSLEQSSSSALEIGSRYKKIKAKTGEGTRAYRSLRSNTCENLSAIPQDYNRSKIYRYQTASPDILSGKPASPLPDTAAVETPTLKVEEAKTDSTPETLSPWTLDSTPETPSPSPPQKLSPLSDLPVRGVPDGCGLEAPPVAVNLPLPSAHELLNLKKGWLMKQGLTKEWQKHWFVLQGSAVMYFKDPNAENNGLMDGIIDLGLVQKVEERDVQRNYGFVVSTLDEREYILSAVTHGIRNNWISALRAAANLNTKPESDSPKPPRNDRDILDTSPSSPTNEIKISRRNTSDSISLSVQQQALNQEGTTTTGKTVSSPPLNRTPTSRLKKTRAGRASSLKSTHSLSSLSVGTPTTTPTAKKEVGSSPVITEPRNLMHDDQFNMIPERDISNDSPILGVSSRNSKTKDYDSLQAAVATEAEQAETLSLKAALQEANLVLTHQTAEINNLRKKLDNMNADMDTTLKNLNTEQVRNSDLEKKLAEVEQENSLLAIKSNNAEKSLREQSKEITSLNQKVREFSDLSSQYKAQVAENKALRQKLEKVERINSGPNWKTLYESLQVQHQKERTMWEDKLNGLELELQNVMETNNEAEQKGHIITDLSHQLQESETRINQLQIQADAMERENAALKEGFDKETSRLKENVKELEEYIDKTDKSEENCNKDTEILRLRSDLADMETSLQQKQELAARLAGKEEEILALNTRLEELNTELKEGNNNGSGRSRSLCSSRENLDKQLRMVRMDSLTELMAPLSDTDQISNMEHDKLVLCYTDVVHRFNKAINEIKALKVSVKQAQSNTDTTEITNMQLSQALKTAESKTMEETKLLSSRIEDLTSKYLTAEKQVRTLKAKIKDSGGKERRRSSTGIRQDELLVHREAESVLEDIESSLNHIEGYAKGGKDVVKDARKKSYEISTKASRARRRSSETSDVSFVERLKKTEKSISDLNRRLSNHGDSSLVYLDSLRKQLLVIISRTREELDTVDLESVLTSLETLVSCSEFPVISALEPGLPKAESVSSHLDTIMSFLYNCVEEVYEKRRDSAPSELTGTKVSSVYAIGNGFSTSAELANLIDAQETSLQAYLLMDLQQQVFTIQTRFFAHSREQALKDYNDVTKSMLLKVLEAKQFVPLSSYSCKKLKALSSVTLTPDTLTALFKRLRRESELLFSRIGTMTAQLMQVFVEAVLTQISDKEQVLEAIRNEVYHCVEEDERMREFQTSLVNVYLVCADVEAAKDPEKINLMANREEAQQSQVEVTRILIDQEIQDFSAALEQKLEAEPEAVEEDRGEVTVDSLSQSIYRLANMVSQKCVTEAQITILTTILGLEGKEDEDDEDLDLDSPVDDFVFNPENMNNECNEFMLVLNNYRQTQSRPAAGARPKLSLTGQTGNTLETSLKSIRKENENKKARLSAALSERKTESPAAEKYQDLRVWCERSMTAMEKSYENLLSELQVQHLKEKDGLKREKEQALAEETRATLSALDAMRKAHESEVQKEVEKFKKEFLSELRSKECIGALQSEYQVDRDEIRREILSVTNEASWPHATVESGGGTEEESSGPPRAPRLTRSPSCPRLYSTLSLASPTKSSGGESGEEPLKSPLTGMVANRKRVFETEY